MKHIVFAVMSMLMVIMTGCSKDDAEVAGYIEHVKINGNLVQAKLDTGADFCSIDAEVIRTFKDGKKTFVEFNMLTDENEKITLTAERTRITQIKLRTGGLQDRPVVLLHVKIGHIGKTVEVNLADRSRFAYRVLLGRNFLENGVLVDSSKKFIFSE